MTYGFEPPDPHEVEEDFAACDRCSRGVPNDEQNLHDGLGRWAGLYLCTDCWRGVCAETQQRLGATVSGLASKYRDEEHRADAIFAQRHASKIYAYARQLMGIDDAVNNGHN